jgi:hypothetical protein
MKQILFIGFNFIIIQSSYGQKKLNQGMIEFSYDNVGYDSTNEIINRFPQHEIVYFQEGKTHRNKSFNGEKKLDEYYDKMNNQTNYVYTVDDIKKNIKMNDGQGALLLEKLKSLIKDSIIETSEKKIIHGYLCKKNILIVAHLKDTTQTELWITDSIDIAHPLDNMDINGIHGTALESFIRSDHKVIHKYCVKISSMKPSEDLFIIPKDAEDGKMKDIMPLLFK